MAGIDIFSSPRLDALDKAMDLATKREQLLSNNLANLNVPGYKRKDLDFNLTLSEAMGQGNSTAQDQLRQFRDFAAQQASDQTSLRPDGNNVDLEREAMGITQTQMRYQALALVTQNYFSNLETAIK